MNGRLEKEIRATKNMTVRIEDSGSEDEKKNDYRLIFKPKTQNSQLLKILDFMLLLQIICRRDIVEFAIT